MTVPSTLDSVSYTATGSDDTYSFSYRIFQDADLLVTTIALDGTISTLVLTMDYTVSGALSYSGGSITLTAGNLDAGVVITLARAPEAVQDTSLQSQAAYDAKVVENALDLLTMIAQWQQNQLDRALIVPSGVTPTPLPDPLALALLQWNAGATGLQNIAIAELGNILVAGNYVVDLPAFTAGSTTALTLTQAPGSVNNAWVYFDGVYQQRTTYTVSGTTLTLGAAVPVDVLSVEVIQAGVLPINTPADGSVATATLQNLAVTAAKIAADSVTTVKIIDAAVTTPKLADAAVTLPKLAAGLLQSGRNFIIDGSMMLANGADRAVTAGDPYGYGKADLWKGALTVSGTGTLAQVTTATIGRTGRALRWTVSAAGASVCTNRTYIEAVDAAGMKNQTASLSLHVGHNAGANRTFTVNVYKANAADNFSAVTAIRSGTPVSVVTGIDTLIAERAISMGDCSNGVMVEVVIASGIVTAKTFDITEAQLELGSQETEFEFRRYADVEAMGAWYFERIPGSTGGHSITPAFGVCTSTTTAVFLILYRLKRIEPTFAVVRGGAIAFNVVDYAGTTSAESTTTNTSVNAGRTSYLIPIITGATLTAGFPAWLLCANSGYMTVDARF